MRKQMNGSAFSISAATVLMLAAKSQLPAGHVNHINGIPSDLLTKEAKGASGIDIKTALSDMLSTVSELREASETMQKEIKSSKGEDPLLTEKMAKINAALDAQEDLNQVAVKAAEHAKAEKDELDVRFKDIELQLAKSGAGSEEANWRDGDEYKAVNEFCKKGIINMDLEQKQILRTDVDSNGGVLVPTELDNELRKLIVEIDAVRAVARVRTMSVKTLDIPTRETIPTATYEGEAEENTEDHSGYVSTSVTAFRQTVTVPVTQDMINDSQFSIESEINADVALAFAEGEGNGFVVGTGVKMPSGFLADARVTDNARQSATAGQLDADDLLLLTGDLKTGYNPSYMMNRRTLAHVRTLKSSAGGYLWLPGINGVVNNSLAGLPYLVANSVPDIATGAFAVAFGDFRRGYEIFDRTGMSIIRDDITMARNAIVKFTFHRWNTGQVIIPEALTAIEIS